METEYIKSKLTQKRSVSDVRSFIDENYQLFNSWSSYITDILSINGYSYEAFGKRTGFSKNTIKSWANGITVPKNREQLIKLAFGLRMNLDETNELLKKRGGYSELYAKDIYDAIAIYVINKRTDNWDDPRYSYSSLENRFEKYRKYRCNYKTDNKYYMYRQTTGVFNDLTEIDDEPEFEQYLEDNKNIFCSSYSKLTKFIETFEKIRINELEGAADNPDCEKWSWHRILSENGIDKSLEKSLSELKNNGIVPKRKHLIAIGINLNMTETDINQMLCYAHMKELYIREKSEALLIYVLKNADRIDPDLRYSNATQVIVMNNSPEIQKRYEHIISEYQNIETPSEDDDSFIANMWDFVREELSKISINDFFDEMM